MRAVLNDMNIVVPIVGSTRKSINKYLKPLRDAGYTVNVHLNEVDATTSLSRLLKRYKDDGRFLDPVLVSKYGNKPTEMYESMKGDFDGYSKWSNEVRKGNKAKLIEEKRSDRVGRDLGSSREDGRKNVEEVFGRAKSKKFSINVDSKGNELTEDQKKKFNNTKAVDSDGALVNVYHGTIREFYEFDKSYANVEGNLGKYEGQKIDPRPTMRSIIRQVPRMIHNPIAVTQSLTDTESIVLFGDVIDYNENPIILILIQNPKNRKGATINVTKLKSGYARSQTQNMLTADGTYYVCPDKEITTEWEEGTRLQLPVATSDSGYIKSVHGLDEKSNIQIRGSKN